MTCIVGVVGDDNVYIGGDSAGVSGWDVSTRRDEKVFRNGPFVMGFTSSFRMGQLLRYKLEPPKLAASRDVYEYMVVDFVDAVRKTLKEGGVSTISDNVEKGGTFLAGIKGRLFSVQSDFQVAEMTNGYDAVGAGRDIALGSLYTTGQLGAKPEERVRAALFAATAHSAAVAGPYVVLPTEET